MSAVARGEAGFPDLSGSAAPVRIGRNPKDLGSPARGPLSLAHDPPCQRRIRKIETRGALGFGRRRPGNTNCCHLQGESLGQRLVIDRLAESGMKYGGWLERRRYRRTGLIIP